MESVPFLSAFPAAMAMIYVHLKLLLKVFNRGGHIDFDWEGVITK
jgi:hypothetical protein